MRLGLDLGTLFTKAVLINNNSEIVKSWFLEHKGDAKESLSVILRELGDYEKSIKSSGLTGAFGEVLCEGGNLEIVDGVSALISGVATIVPGARNILNIGGGSLTLIELNDEGEFLSMSSNSLCAAGTGSFLDQQADRMGINHDELDRELAVARPPEIATRCAVFAKTDIIHRQQEGYTKQEIWCGLCKGLTSTILNTLLKGKKLNGIVALTGGVALNPQIQGWLRREYGEALRIPALPHLVQAIGAAHSNSGTIDDLRALISGETSLRSADSNLSAGQAGRTTKPPLKLELSSMPSFQVQGSWIDESGTEIRLTEWERGKSLHAFLGIDIGSTSTKAVLINNEDRIFADFYRKTEGDPIGATRRIFKAIKTLERETGTELKILGAATTGSGRKMIGEIIGADAIVNEITAHAHGALHFNPEIETIFEIGGQDSKYIHLRNGRVHLVNMNYVCAAGTGSFIEEQANRLGFRVQDIGTLVMGIAPPHTSDRCTVFMEQDIDRLLRHGYTRQEVMAAVMYSVVQNYLHKVVGSRPISKEKIFFQGATARNAGLVAAFESHLNREIVVNPSCHVMGALGSALIARAKMTESGETTEFRGLDILERNIRLSSSNCELCSNLCRITYAGIDGLDSSPSWGYMCGREPEDEKARYRENHELFDFRDRLLLTVGSPAVKKKNTRTAGIPWVLSTHTYFPLWRTFLSELGYNVRISPRTTDEILRLSLDSVQADFCLPVKLLYGHVRYLNELKNIDFIFLPHMIAGEKKAHTSNSCFCPYLQAGPSLVSHLIKSRGHESPEMLSPVVDFRDGESEVLKKLTETFRVLGIKAQRIRRAFRKAMEAQMEFTRRCTEKGRGVLRELKEKGQSGMVIIGRPYNVCDPRANLNVPKKIAGLGYTVIPMDMIPFDTRNIGEEFYNMFWNYGQVIINALKVVRDSENLFPVYLTNFSCGPDSFLLTYAEEISGQKPLLILELDEHGADAGYSTRIEAFIDSLKSYTHTESRFSIYFPRLKSSELVKKRILVPPMHPAGARLVAAAMRGRGYDACALPEDTQDILDTGRSLTRGAECMPAALTIGNVVKYLKNNDGDKQFAIFMPTSTGPCRFGQYATLHRIILNRLGYREVPIISPSADNAYYGLDMELRKDIWKAILAGDILFKMACKTRPYELKRGETNALLEKSIRLLEVAFETRSDYRIFLEKSAHSFAALRRLNNFKPLVGIVGEIFVRCNPFSNGFVIDAVEKYGGEAWLAPVSEWIQYTSILHKKSALKLNNWSEIFKAYFKNRFIVQEEHRAFDVVKKILGDRVEPDIKDVLEAGKRYLPEKFTAEAILTIGRAIIFIKQGASLVVNVSPFTCMPGTISAAIFQRIQEEYGVPIINLFYDGERTENERLRSFMRNLHEKREQERSSMRA